MLSPPPCDGGVECIACGSFFCHDCLCAVCQAIQENHGDLQDSWLEATSTSSPDSVLKIPVGHCCRFKDEKVSAREDTLAERSKLATSMTMSTAPLLAGTNHYYQYDIAIGSTPQECVDIFSLGASASNAPVTHAVFPIDIALDVARGNHIVPLLDLDGPIITVPSEELSVLPTGFNKANYRIQVVKIATTRMDTPRPGKINTFF